MKIECELTAEEHNVLIMALGMATGMVLGERYGRAKTLIRITNKLFQASPDFTPYDENGMDAFIGGFPRRTPPQ